LVQIDFGYIFNEQTKMFDAPRFAIPSNFKAAIPSWELFVDRFFSLFSFFLFFFVLILLAVVFWRIEY